MRVIQLVCGPVLGAIVFAGACGRDKTSGDTAGSPPVEQPPGGGTSTPPDSTPPAVAQGDPCRGVALPDDQHFVAAGMCARLVGANLGKIRQITFAPNGVLFAVQTTG